ncbi:MAG: hypothetical protein GNW80_10595 [Asgard group archaeon]|nr:hypothetical protein [Asgard group archaeon]
MTKNIADNFPKWLQIFYIVLGSITVIFGFIVMINVFTEAILVLLLGIALLLISINRFIIGNFDFKMNKEGRISNIAIGLLILPFAIVAIAGSLTITIGVIIVLLATALILLGIQNIARGCRNHKRKDVYRLVIITIGYLIVGLAILSLGLDTIQDKFKILILGVIIVIIGLIRIGEGILGKKVMKQPKHEYV